MVNLFLLPGEVGRPADVLIPGWSSGKDVAYDVTVINPLQDSEVNQTAHALSVAQRRKLDKSWEVPPGLAKDQTFYGFLFRHPSLSLSLTAVKDNPLCICEGTIQFNESPWKAARLVIRL